MERQAPLAETLLCGTETIPISELDKQCRHCQDIHKCEKLFCEGTRQNVIIFVCTRKK